MIRNMGNRVIDRYELEKALEEYPSRDSNAWYCSEVFDTAMWLNDRNEKAKIETGNYLFMPRVLIPLAFDAQWYVQHAVDSYGCDYDWAYSDDGFNEILIEEGSIDFDDYPADDEEFEAEYEGKY